MVSERANRRQEIGQCYQSLVPFLNEQGRRLFAGAHAKALGRGGVRLVAAATGMAINTVRSGIKQLDSATPQPLRSRAPGGGRKTLRTTNPALMTDLEKLVDPVTRGDPMSPLRWTSKSTTKLTEELREQGHQVSQRTVC